MIRVEKPWINKTQKLILLFRLWKPECGEIEANVP